MPNYSVYISPVRRTALLFLVLLLLLLYFKPSYFISYAGFTELDWSDMNTYWILIGSFTGVFLLFNLIPGLYLASEYYKYDRLAYQEISGYPLQEFRRSINSVDCMSSYSNGWWAPGAVHADYWYYTIRLENGEVVRASHFLAEELDLFQHLDEETGHMYTAFPTIKWEDFVIPKDKDFTNVEPSKALIKRFEKRYRDYAPENLKNISCNSSYRREARMAAENLLLERQKRV